MTCHLISQSINIMKVPSKMKSAIWDICMSENRCLYFRFKDFSFLLSKSIRPFKMTRKYDMGNSGNLEIMKNHDEEFHPIFRKIPIMKNLEIQVMPIMKILDDEISPES